MLPEGYRPKFVALCLVNHKEAIVEGVLAVGDRFFIRLLDGTEAHMIAPFWNARHVGRLQHELLKPIV